MKTLFDTTISLGEAQECINNGADVNEVDFYGFSPLFDTYASLTSKDSDFFQMCKDYQEKIQSTINVRVNDVGNNLGY